MLEVICKREELIDNESGDYQNSEIKIRRQVG